MSESNSRVSTGLMNEQSNPDQFGEMVFWDGNGRIVPHLLYEYFVSIGVGKYYPEGAKWKSTDPVIVKRNNNVISEVNIAFLLEAAKNFIYARTEENGESGPILDSLHKNTSLFGDKNLKLLPVLNLEFIADTKDAGYFFYRNGVVKVTKEEVIIQSYDEFDQYVWESSIVELDYEPIASAGMAHCDFNNFITDLTIVDDHEKSDKRLRSLKSGIGYLLHRFKDGTTNQAIILMDVYVDGMPNGGSGKSLLMSSIGKIRKLDIIDGKQFDQKEWFSLSSVNLNSEIILFDDVAKNFDFERLFPLTSGGLHLRRKFKNHVHIPHEKSPKIALTTNYAINGDSSSHRRRKWEFEVSTTYSSEHTPREKFGRNFFDDWSERDWNLFFNTMIGCVQVYLNEGLLRSEPINLRLTKMVNLTCEEFLEFSSQKIQINVQLNKRSLYDDFIKDYPEFRYQLKQRSFTQWLRVWGEYKRFRISEGHSGEIRYIVFSELNES